jgi:2-keto-4-pentenoate hydratase/2-oxohepta-3-ene-1,7-dioic acid hydratase in catechol pathway
MWFPAALALLTLIFTGAAWSAEKQAVKYVRFQAGETIAYGILEGDRVRQLDGDLFASWKPTEKLHRLADVKLLVPCQPTKILAAAVNYKSHAAAQDVAAPPSAEQPVRSDPQFFYKPVSCLIATGENIVIPQDAVNVHYEGEMVIVVGKRAKDVPVEAARDYVLGVTCGNDVSAREWQKADVQWWRAKGCDTFGPCGPCIAAGIDYDNLLLRLRLNGEVKQEQRTSDLIHSVARLVSFASRHVTLEPGDLIYTGTPGKTSAIKPGDVVEVELEGVGVLRNGVVGSAAGATLHGS